MHIRVNGEERDIAEGSSVMDLIRELELQSDRVAIEVNLKILDRGEFDRHILQKDDQIEILSFIGGGSYSRNSKLGNENEPRSACPFLTPLD